MVELNTQTKEFTLAENASYSDVGRFIMFYRAQSAKPVKYVCLTKLTMVSVLMSLNLKPAALKQSIKDVLNAKIGDIFGQLAGNALVIETENKIIFYE